MNRDSENPLTLFFSFGKFSVDIAILIEKGIIVPIAYHNESRKSGVADKYEWTKSKTSLAEYFKWIGNNEPYVPGGFWAPVENIFLIDGKPIKRGSLRRLAGNNANWLKPDESKDFTEIKKIVEEYREKVEKQKEEQKTLLDKFQSIEKIIINTEKTGDIETLRAVKEKIKKILT
jgi:hypothetical protein